MLIAKCNEWQTTSSSRVFSPPLMRCCILSRRTSSMSRKILFRLALMFVLISSSCSFAKSCRIRNFLQHLRRGENFLRD